MHFALQKLKILPSTWLEMDRLEKAFVVASIQIYAKESKKGG